MRRHVLAVVAVGVLLTGASTGCAGAFSPALAFHPPPLRATQYHPSPQQIRVLQKQERALEAHAKAEAHARLRALRRARSSRIVPAQPMPMLGTGAGHPQAATIALKYLGVPYVWGGSTPHGFDSSGLVMYVYRQLGIKLPHYTVSQWNMTVPISRAKMKRGDLVFFEGLGHVGIYLGDRKYVSAPHTGAVVRIDRIGAGHLSFDGARRVP
jgi:cell wall-associated NlpC family hydrolase